MAKQFVLLFLQLLTLFFVLSDTFRRDVFSTKTAYSSVYYGDQVVEQNELMKTKFKNKQCVAVNAQVVLRHGARYPGYKDIRKMTALHEKLKIIVRSSNFPFLQNWENDFPESEEKQLVDEGEDEQYGLGQRFGKRLLQLYGESVRNIKFISSSKERCTESALAFYDGLTEIVLHEAYDDLRPIINDDILRFHTKCDKFIEEVENNQTHMKYHKMFKTSNEINKIADNVQKRLGIEHATITAGKQLFHTAWESWYRIR